MNPPIEKYGEYFGKYPTAESCPENAEQCEFSKKGEVPEDHEPEEDYDTFCNAYRSEIDEHPEWCGSSTSEGENDQAFSQCISGQEESLNKYGEYCGKYPKAESCLEIAK
jgi:hypothetical protein